MTGLPFDLRLGRWQDVLADVTCDSLITDAPFSGITHDGFKSGSDAAAGVGGSSGVTAYPPITRADAVELAASWNERVRRWVVIFGDHVSREWHREAWSLFPEWYAFNAPVVWVKKGAAPRLAGDGPASHCEFITVARRRGMKPDGARPGFYIVKTRRGVDLVGAKDPDGMCAVVRDYSRPGDIIVDPYAGSGTTLLAARSEGRGAVGAEVLPKHYAIARRLIDRGVTPNLFQEAA